MLGKFAVVRNNQPYQFSMIHQSWQSAKDEASRLCRENKVKFFVIKIVAEVELRDVEVRLDNDFANEPIPF